MRSKRLTPALGLIAAMVASAATLAAPPPAEAIPRLDHVFIIVMENHAASEIIGNTNAPFTNAYISGANLANNYWGVGHPSLTNYLEIVGGSNFAVYSDNNPAWHSSCASDLLSGTVNGPTTTTSICPIAGSGTDAGTPATDVLTNPGTTLVNDPIDPAPATARTIANQLVDAGLSYRSYQESLPPYGADGVSWSDGLLSSNTPVSGTKAAVAGTPHLYAAKHNPFVYFADVQSGANPRNSLRNSVGFERLYADLKSGEVPNYAFVVPNQCHDQHGRGSTEVGPYCAGDPNPQLIQAGDVALQNLVTAIKASPAWQDGRNVIVTVWDENDYGAEGNQVVALVDTNYGAHGRVSNIKYNHFSLLKTVEAGFRLPYLNHAADSSVPLMSDLFAR